MTLHVESLHHQGPVSRIISHVAACIMHLPAKPGNDWPRPEKNGEQYFIMFKFTSYNNNYT